jgi:hypothetical protein
MSGLDIPQHRLHNQHISRPTFETAGEVVQWMGAMQAQDYAGAKYSVGLRMAGATDADIEAAIREKQIVRTWPLRGTLHFVSAADIRWMLTLLAPGMIAGNARRYKELELDADTLTRSTDLLAKALAGGKELSRTELLAMLEANGISTKGQRAPYMLEHASLEGLICQGVAVRNTPTYMLIDEALPPTKPLARDEALAALAGRYFASRGPATLYDFMWWSGLGIANARAAVEAVRSQFDEAKIDGQTYWLPKQTPTSQAGSSLYLLPGFDEYLLAYRDRKAVLEAEHSKKVVPGGNGMFMSTIVVDGRVVGLWRRTLKKKHVEVTAQPFESLNADEKGAFEEAAARYGRFLGLPVKVV